MRYLFGLLLSLLLMVSLARADNAPYTLNWNNFGSPDVGVFLGPSLGVDQVNGETFGAALPLAGGIEAYSFTIFVNSDSSGIPMDLFVIGGCNGQDGVIQYPPGYVFPDPSTTPPDGQYPYDNCFNLISDDVFDPSMIRKTAHGYVFVPGTYDGFNASTGFVKGALTITGATPEPGSMEFILIGLFAFALVAATTKKPQ